MIFLYLHFLSRVSTLSKRLNFFFYYILFPPFFFFETDSRRFFLSLSTMECLKNTFVKDRILDGRFRAVAPLNQGSFGMVFVATDLKTGQDVAIKCIDKPSSTDMMSPFPMDDRFEELECHRLLSRHPNLVNLTHSFETATHVYLVLEFCANGDLYEAIRLNRGPLETEHVRDFMLQLVSAVEFMHVNGMYHRDIKPENIFLTHDGSMKLGDLGLATRNSWCHEACVGSDRYMAPEQYDPGTTGYSPAHADIWAMGICLLNVLFARNPFVTPSESDVLFADYVRDRQSLFDIFPNMSQDTFEILGHAMSLDPNKRSLAGLRQSILRAVSFTTDDEPLDEFCTDDREVVPASANREPLRTPSIQSPMVNQGDSFPWAKALQATPQLTTRQLSVIPDNDSYTEDLFPPSETAGTSWYSINQGTSLSTESVLDSTLGESIKSTAFPKPQATTTRRHRYPPPSDPVMITGSLPSRANHLMPSLSSVFGRNKKDQISKSWCDLWDEEESENEELSAFEQRREQNSRSWSHESHNAAAATSAVSLPESDSSLTISQELKDESASPRTSSESDSATPNAVNTRGKPKTSPKEVSTAPRGSPKKSLMDKWSALGDKRRGAKSRGGSLGDEGTGSCWRKDWGLGSSGFNYGSWIRKGAAPASPDRRRRPYLEKDWRRDAPDSAKQQRPPSGYDGSVDEDLDLVGGWHDLHL